LESHESNLKKVINKITEITTNSNLKFLIIFLFFSEIGYSYFDNMVPVELLKIGISNNIYAFCWFLSTCIEGITGYFISKYNNHTEMTVSNFIFNSKL